MVKYTVAEINNISNTKKAVQYQIYTDVKGNYYVGTSEGTLVFSPRADGVPYGDSTVSAALDSALTKVEAIGGSFVTQDELDAAERRARCFAASMAIVL